MQYPGPLPFGCPGLQLVYVMGWKGSVIAHSHKVFSSDQYFPELQYLALDISKLVFKAEIEF